jgi:hypothetical protein
MVELDWLERGDTGVPSSQKATGRWLRQIMWQGRLLMILSGLILGVWEDIGGR